MPEREVRKGIRFFRVLVNGESAMLVKGVLGTIKQNEDEHLGIPDWRHVADELISSRLSRLEGSNAEKRSAFMLRSA